MHKIYILFFLIVIVSCKQNTTSSTNNDIAINTEELNENQLQQKTVAELRILRNAVFARKGYVFKSEDLNAHFKEQAWYTPNADTLITLTEPEQAYVNKIKEIEQGLKASEEVPLEEEEELTAPVKDSIVVNLDVISSENRFQGIKDSLYTFSDNQGAYSLLLSRAEDNKAIYAYCSKKDSLKSPLLWHLKDFLAYEDDGFIEEEISFVKELVNVTDIDGDGLVDPILVYTTQVNRGYKESRLKIVIHHKNRKVAIRHKNALVKKQRKTEVDAAFYGLPSPLKIKVKEIMENLEEMEYAAFNKNALKQLDI